MDQLQQLEACRICVTCFPLQEMDFIHLFQPNEEFQQELNFIQNEITHWQLKIQPEDGLPQRICANCFAKFCSIQAFRKECQKAQEDLIETVLMQQSEGNTSPTNVESQNGQIKNSDNPLPLMGNFEPTSVVLNADNNVLVSSVNLTQSDVSLNDFPVFDHQQFAHFDNPSLMDEASTLLDGSNLIAGETTQELGFLPSQNLFTFETAEPPSTGTLPLVETDTTSIINDMLDQKPNVQENEQNIIIKHEDLDEMLKHSIIPTTATKKSTQTQQQNEQIIMENNNNLEIKMQPETNSKKGEGNHYNSNYIKVRNDSPNAIITFVNRDDSNSDLECDETDVNTRLKGQSYACHYCFCPETGPIEHLVFPNEDALSQHFFDVHDPNRPYTCPKCPQSYKTQLLRDNHVRLLHKIVELQTCNYCQKRLKGSIEVHQYNCQYVGDWECEQCKEKFEQTPLYRFRLHQRQHERITTKQFKCRLCERNFAKKANLEAHQRIHKVEAQTNASHCCNVCKATFVDDYELKRHKYQQHNAEHPLKCKICLRGFSSKVFLQRHINQFHPDHNPNHSNASSATSTTTTTTTTPTSSGATSPTYQHVCLNCNVGFKTLKKLQTHLLMGRDTNGNCLYSTSNKLERRKLQLQGVFPCFHCPRRFHLRSQLDKHLNTHDARLRPYQCEQCVTRCRTAFELKQHVNVAHLNIKAFSCDKCGKCFGYKKYLRDHMLFHAEINVKCTEEGCDYVCKNEKALNDHIRHKHRLLSCEYCHEQFTRQKLTAHLRKIHRSEIDVELACESDNYYKSQLLNNNNDITQISFNLLNTQQQQQTQTQQQLQLNKTTTTTSLTSPSITSSTSLVKTSLTESQIQTTSALTITTNSSSSSSPPPSSSLLTTIIATSTAPTLSSSSPSSCLTSSSSDNLAGTNLSSCSLVESHNHLINDVEHHDQQQQTQSQQQNHPDQLHNLFANDAPDGTNGTSTLALNGLVSSTDHVDDANDHLNLVSNDASNIFLVSSNTSSTANDNQLDQYFMASLIDTEQEIIVT